MGDLHSARQFYINSVLPAYERMAGVLMDGLLGNRRDLIALCEAASACLHLADQIARDQTVAHQIPGAPKSRDYIKDLAARNFYFPICRDVANAYKHHQITDQDRRIEGVDSLKEKWAIVRFNDELGQYWAARKIVEVYMLDGSRILGDDLIRECIKEWGLELLRLGIVSRAPEVQSLPHKFLRRADVPQRPRIRSIGVVNEYIESQHVLMRHVEAGDRYLPLEEPIGGFIDIDASIEVTESPLPRD